MIPNRHSRAEYEIDWLGSEAEPNQEGVQAVQKPYSFFRIRQEKVNWERPVKSRATSWGPEKVLHTALVKTAERHTGFTSKRCPRRSAVCTGDVLPLTGSEQD